MIIRYSVFCPVLSQLLVDATEIRAEAMNNRSTR